jgi:hypothetical protein
VIKLLSSARPLARNSRLFGRRSPGLETLHAWLVLHAVRMYSRTHAGCSMQTFLEVCFHSLSPLRLSAWLPL